MHSLLGDERLCLRERPKRMQRRKFQHKRISPTLFRPLLFNFQEQSRDWLKMLGLDQAIFASKWLGEWAI